MYKEALEELAGSHVVVWKLGGDYKAGNKSQVIPESGKLVISFKPEHYWTNTDDCGRQLKTWLDDNA